jgi:hypothetical protein
MYEEMDRKPWVVATTGKAQYFTRLETGAVVPIIIYYMEARAYNG